MSDGGRTRLTSWKEIAAYLRREVRTVIRWEKERGLPVHRVPGGQGRSVFAFTDELDRWAAGELTAQESPPPRAVRLSSLAATIAAGAVLLLLGVAAAWARGWPHREMSRVSVSAASIDAVDEGGRALWSYRFPSASEIVKRRVSQVVDLTGDDHPEAIVTAILTTPQNDVGTGVLYAFDEGGGRLWERSIDKPLAFGAGDFEAPWLPDDVSAFTSGGRPFIAWAVHHVTWWPSMLAVFDARGSQVGTFVNAGWLRTSRGSLDGRHLIAAGFSNSRNGAAYAVLDARNPDGASPEDPGSPYECRNCPAGRPLRYFVVDWSDIASGMPPDDRDALVSVHPLSGNIELRSRQRRNAELIVELSPSFEIRKRSVSDSFWEWHQRLEQNGTLTHARDRCPYRDGPIVREWTPSGGWKTHGAPAGLSTSDLKGGSTRE